MKIPKVRRLQGNGSPRSITRGLAIAVGFIAFIAGSCLARPTSAAAQPSISQVTWTVAANGQQTIVITGTGFGSQGTYNGTNNFLSIHDMTRGWNAGWNHPGHDWVGVVVTLWSDSQIIISGFTGMYGLPWRFQPGDQVQIEVWNPSEATQQTAAVYTTSVPAPTLSSAATLVLTFQPTGGYSTFMLNHSEAQKLLGSLKQQLGTSVTPQTQFAMAVYDTPPQGAQAIQDFALFFSAVQAAQNTLSNLYEFTTDDTGYEILTIEEAAELVGVDPFSKLAKISTGELQSFYQNLDSAYTNFAKASATICAASHECQCAGWQPDYIVDPTQALTVVATSLSSQPSGSLTLTFGYRDSSGLLS